MVCVDVDGRFLLRVGPRNLAPLCIRLDIPLPRVAHTYEALRFEGESEPPLTLLSSPCPHCTLIAREKDVRTVAHVLQPAKDMVWMWTSSLAPSLSS